MVGVSLAACIVMNFPVGSFFNPLSLPSTLCSPVPNVYPRSPLARITKMRVTGRALLRRVYLTLRRVYSRVVASLCAPHHEQVTCSALYCARLCSVACEKAFSIHDRNHTSMALHAPDDPCIKVPSYKSKCGKAFSFCFICSIYSLFYRALIL